MKCKCYTKTQSTCFSVQGEGFPQPFSPLKSGNTPEKCLCVRHGPTQQEKNKNLFACCQEKILLEALMPVANGISHD